MGKMDNKVVMVTGGSSGIGKGMAQRFVEEGAQVYLLARNEDNLKASQGEIGAAGYFPVDINDLDSIGKAVNNVYQRHGKLDVFVQNAGSWKPSSYRDESDENFDHITQLDYIAPVKLVRYLLRRFDKVTENELVVLNTLSQAAIDVKEDGEAYGPAKSAFWAWMRHARYELKRNNADHIKLYGIFPGTVVTEGTIEGIKRGILEDPTSLESVVDLAVDQITGKTSPHLDVIIRWKDDGQGIRREYISAEPPYNVQNVEVVDRDYQPPKSE